jgi:hypothetical protein
MKVSAARQWEVEYLFLEDWPRNLRKEKKNLLKLHAVPLGMGVLKLHANSAHLC